MYSKNLRPNRYLYFFSLRLLTPLVKCFFPFKVIGAENIPNNGSFIVCCNHKSVYDPFFLAVPFHRQVHFMAKLELFQQHGPLVSWLLYKLGAFPVKRDKGDAESVKIAIHILNSGGVVGIFPQGKCVFDNTPFKPKAGAVLVASKAHAPILPASIYCDGVIKPFRRITVRIGRLIPYEELKVSENSHASIHDASEIISKRINELLEERN